MQSHSNFLENMFIHCLFVLDRQTRPDWQFREPSLPYCNMMFVYNGSGDFSRNHHTYTVSAGDFVFFHQGDSRVLTTDPNNPLHCYAVNFLYTYPYPKPYYPYTAWGFEKKKFNLDFITKIRPNSVVYTKLIQLFNSLCRINISDIPLKSQKQQQIIMDILHLVLSYNDFSDTDYANRNTVNRVIDYMSRHYTETITLDALARSCGISVSYLGKIFKSATGHTPMQYLLAMRLQKAKQLLADGASVSGAAAQTGFSDIYYFSRTFKAHEGIPPSLYGK